jgi:hypothetical protein
MQCLPGTEEKPTHTTVKIAEAYIHLNIDVSSDFLRASKGYLYHRGKALATDFFRDDIHLYCRR